MTNIQSSYAHINNYWNEPKYAFTQYRRRIRSTLFPMRPEVIDILEMPQITMSGDSVVPFPSKKNRLSSQAKSSQDWPRIYIPIPKVNRSLKHLLNKYSPKRHRNVLNKKTTVQNKITILLKKKKKKHSPTALEWHSKPVLSSSSQNC